MSDLPASEKLAELVSSVTQTMFGMSFGLAESDGANQQLPWKRTDSTWRTVLLPINGRRALTVAIASDQPSGKMLGGGMFSCPPDQVDSSMIDDALCELANIVAGQVKRSLGLDQALGLPKVLEADHPLAETAENNWRSAALRNANREVHVWVAIIEADHARGGA